MKTTKSMLPLALALCSLISSCGLSESPDRAPPEVAPEPSGESSGPPPRVAATSPPVAWLLERLAGPAVVMVSISEARARPSAERILELSEAELILTHGAGLEPWIGGASLPDSRTVVTTAGLDLIELGVRTHSHGAEGEHSHQDVDPRTWEDPIVFLQQAKVVAAALADLLVDERPAIEDRLRALEIDLTALSTKASSLFEGAGDVRWSSPSGFGGYLARAFSLNHRSFEIGPDQVAASHEIEHYIRWSDGSARSITLWPTAPSAEVLDSLAGSSRHLVLDPLDAALPTGYRYLERSRKNLEILRQALGAPNGR